MLTYFQKNSNNLNPQQKAIFAQLQHLQRLETTKQTTDSSFLSSVNSNNSVDSSQSQTTISKDNSQFPAPSSPLNETASDDFNDFSKLTVKLNDQLDSDESNLNGKAMPSSKVETNKKNGLSSPDLTNFDESDLKCLLSSKASNDSVSENLFLEFGLDVCSFKNEQRSYSSQFTTANSNCALTSKQNNKTLQNKYLTSENSFFRTYLKCDSHSSSPIHLSIDMTANEALALIKGTGRSGHIHNSLLFDDCRPPSPVAPPYPPLTKKQLMPSTPSVFVSCTKLIEIRFLL